MWRFSTSSVSFVVVLAVELETRRAVVMDGASFMGCCQAGNFWLGRCGGQAKAGLEEGSWLQVLAADPSYTAIWRGRDEHQSSFTFNSLLIRLLVDM